MGRVQQKQDHWNTGASDDFATAIDWSSGTVPGPTDVAVLDAGGAYTVTSSSDETVNSLMTAVDSALRIADGVFTMTAGTGLGANAGLIEVADGATLNVGGTVKNIGTIALDSTGDATTLGIIGSVSLTGAGDVLLSDNPENLITGSGRRITLTNVDNTISGAGTIGNAGLALLNQKSGVIDATGTNSLIIQAAVNNAGMLESDGIGGLTINGAVNNSGLLTSIEGDLLIKGAVTGSGKAVIYGGGEIEFAGANSTQNVTFAAGASGLLTLDASKTFHGTISGFALNEAIDLADINFSGSTTAVYTANAQNTGGVLTVKDGTSTANITLTGHYVQLNFDIQSDGHGGTLLIDPTATTYFVAPAINAVTLQANTGDLVFQSSLTNTGTVESDGNFNVIVSLAGTTNSGTLRAANTSNFIVQGTTANSGAGLVTAVNAADMVLQGAVNNSGTGIVLATDNAAITIEGAVLNFNIIETTLGGAMQMQSAVNNAKSIFSFDSSQISFGTSGVPNTNTIGNSGVIDALDNSQITMVAGNGTVGGITNLGIIRTEGNGNIAIQSSNLLTNNGTIELNGASNITIVSTTAKNFGTLKANDTSSLLFTGTLTNFGTLFANGGFLQVNGAVGSGGIAQIAGNGVLDFGSVSAENVTFTAGSTGTLRLDATSVNVGQYTGLVSGFAPGEFLDLTYIHTVNSPTVIYTANATNTGGTLHVAAGAVSGDILLRGNYANHFAVSSDGHGGTFVTYSTPPVTWVGPASGGTWSTPGNWSTGAVPVSTDNVDLSSDSITIAGSTQQVASITGVGTLTMSGGGVLAVTNTGSDGNNAGTIIVNDGGKFALYGTLNNTGTIQLNSTSTVQSTNMLAHGTNVVLTGGGNIFMSNVASTGPGITGGNRISASSAGVNAVIGGAVTTGNIITLSFTNASLGVIPSISYTVVAGDTLSTIATGLGNAINSNATLNADNIHANVNGSIVQIVEPLAIANSTVVGKTLSIGATETISFTTVAGAPLATGQLAGGGSFALTNVDNLIQGSGTIGGNSALTFTNGGTVDATGTNPFLINTGTNTIVNTGNITNDSTNFMTLLSTVTNSGTIENVTGTGIGFFGSGVSLNNTVTGAVVIDAGRSITFQSGGTGNPPFTAGNIIINNAGNIQFLTGAPGTNTNMSLHANNITLQGGGTVDLGSGANFQSHIFGNEAVVTAVMGGALAAGDILTATFTNPNAAAAGITGFPHSVQHTVTSGEASAGLPAMVQLIVNAINADATYQSEHIHATYIAGTTKFNVQEGDGAIANSTVLSLTTSNVGPNHETVTFSTQYGTATDGHLTGGSANVFNNVDNTIDGSGQIGLSFSTIDQNDMTLINSGLIIDDTGNPLSIHTGGNHVVNNSTGIIEATANSAVTINSAVDNSGTLDANGGHITLFSAISGSGKATIENLGILDLAINSGAAIATPQAQVAVNFGTGGGSLQIDHLTNTTNAKFTGTIAGFNNSTDDIDLGAINFTTGNAQASYNAGTQVLTISDGSNAISLAFTGNPSDFAVVHDFIVTNNSGHVDLLHV